jgi:hypothetical protein
MLKKVDAGRFYSANMLNMPLLFLLFKLFFAHYFWAKRLVFLVRWAGGNPPLHQLQFAGTLVRGACASQKPKIPCQSEIDKGQEYGFWLPDPLG